MKGSPSRRLCFGGVLFILFVTPFLSFSNKYASMGSLSEMREAIRSNSSRSMKTMEVAKMSRTADATTMTTTPVVVAHAITMTKCGRSRKIGDAFEPLMILRHSIHQNSVHSDDSDSKYSYQMIAFVYKDGGCDELLPMLKQIGYLPLLVDVPVDVDAISHNEYYRTEVKHNGCCGEKEFIKLHSLNMTDYPVIVHWDVDAIATLPMDDAFDVILYDKDSTEGHEARQRLEIERPKIQRVPDDDIDFLYTGAGINKLEHPPINGGFFIFRTSRERFHDMLRVVMLANYTKERGWGDMGYGSERGYPGGMTIQGFMGYYYEQIHTGHSLELDNCRWNQASKGLVQFDRWNNITVCTKMPPPGVQLLENTPENGMCEDCGKVPFSQRRTVHFQGGRKPWYCQLKDRKDYWFSMTESIRAYFLLRRDLEDKIASTMGRVPPVYNGTFHPEIFLNFCNVRSLNSTAVKPKGNAVAGELLELPKLAPAFDMKEVYEL